MKRLRIHMVGNAHLDPAWMWTWDEGMEAYLATVRAALARIDETPGFIFTGSSAAQYQWMEEIEPELFERVREEVMRGRWVIVGGWWTQADCNIPSGEGFARQALIGQRYFIERFGRAATVGYSPDAFGHNIGLPQLLARAGLRDYIYCRPDPTELQLPSPLLEWRSPDGASVLAYRVPMHYNMYETSVPKKVVDLVAAYESASAVAPSPLAGFGDTWCLFYGVGNHGGGPTREHIRQIIGIDADASSPQLMFSSPDAFFADVRRERDGRMIPTWADDLQIDAPGCYSVHSEIKRLNRRSEYSLVCSEALSTLAAATIGAPYPADDLAHAWDRVCFNHFHDIVCGVAIREALDDAIAEYGAALSIATRASRHAVQRVARAIDANGDGQTVLVVNPHAWAIDGNVRVELWHDIEKSLWTQRVDVRVTTDDGVELPCQLGFTSGKIGRDRIAISFPASVPALGWQCYRLYYGERSSVDMPFRGTINERLLANDHVRLEVDEATGGVRITRIDPSGTEEIAVTLGAIGLVIEDTTDTWGHGVERFDAVVGRFDAPTATVVESGATHATLRVRTHFGVSWLQQDFRLDTGSHDIVVDVKVFWAEHNRMLKLAFATRFTSVRSHAQAAYSIATKECDGTERPCGTWCAVESVSGDGSVAIVSDAKHAYSCDVVDGGAELRLTVLRSPSYANHIPHPFDELEDLDYIDQGIQRFRYRIVTTSGGIDGAELSRSGAELVVPAIAHIESAHDAGAVPLARTFTGARVEPSNVIVTTLKQAADGGGWIVRVHEASGKATQARIEIPFLNVSWSLDIGAHELRTYRILDGEIAETDLVERPV